MAEKTIEQLAAEFQAAEAVRQAATEAWLIAITKVAKTLLIEVPASEL